MYTLRNVYDCVYMFTCDEQYDLNMHFLRYQEYYESPEQRFFRRPFKLIDYMRWYAVERPDATGVFDYTRDWSGFNVPDWVFTDLFYRHKISDRNVYDETMQAVYESIVHREGDKRTYIIGCVEGSCAIEHELAHGMWYVDDGYRRDQAINVAKLKTKKSGDLYEKIRATLLNEGYCDASVDDEVQAYLSTGYSGELESAMLDLGYDETGQLLVTAPFRETYEQYATKATLSWKIAREEERDDETADCE